MMNAATTEYLGFLTLYSLLRPASLEKRDDRLSQVILSKFTPAQVVELRTLGESMLAKTWGAFQAFKTEDELFQHWVRAKQEFSQVFHHLQALITPALGTIESLDELLSISADALNNTQPAVRDRLGGDLADTFQFALHTGLDADRIVLSRAEALARASLLTHMDPARIGRRASAGIGFILGLFLLLTCLDSDPKDPKGRAIASFAIRKLRREATIYLSETMRLLGSQKLVSNET